MRELIINAKDYLEKLPEEQKVIEANKIAEVLFICTRMKKELILKDILR